MRRLIVIALAGACSFCAAEQPRDSDIFVRPALGRPALVRPGGSFTVVLREPLGKKARFWLRASLWPEVVCPLEPVATQADGRVRTLRVPPDAPQLVWDLLMQDGAATHVRHHCVGVLGEGRRLRIVHISDLRIGELTAPQPSETLRAEVNLLAPDLVVLTGDLVDAACENPDATWASVAGWLRGFEAPLIIAIGDHDDPQQFARWITPEPVALLPVGPHRVLVLRDHARNPLLRDAQQLRWIEHALAGVERDGITIVVSHDARPGLLAAWRRAGVLSERLAQSRLGLWLAGGTQDWDGRSFRSLIDAAEPLHYLATAAGSTTTAGGAPGVPHYRVIEIGRDRVRELSDDPNTDPPASLAAGGLRVVEQPASGAGWRRLRVLNAHARPLRRLALWLRLPATGSAEPWLRGGRIAQRVRTPIGWLVQVRFDAPDRGATELLAGVGAPPQEPGVQVEFLLPDVLTFEPRSAGGGITYQRLLNGPAWIELHNIGRDVRRVRPMVRLDGRAVAYRTADEGAFVLARGIELRPGERVRLRLDLSVARVRPGPHEVQVYLYGLDPLAPLCRRVRVEIARPIARE